MLGVRYMWVEEHLHTVQNKEEGLRAWIKVLHILHFTHYCIMLVNTFVSYRSHSTNSWKYIPQVVKSPLPS